MKDKKDIVKVSKTLSRLLRHTPQDLGLEPDPNGWVRIDVLLKACREHGIAISLSDVLKMEQGTDKKRFEIWNGKIRATHGHSIRVTPGEPIDPPALLYHGTVVGNLEQIFLQGLKPGTRQFVHLSVDADSAGKVAQRHGQKVVVLQVDAKGMKEAGHSFYCAHGVWLTQHVPSTFCICKSYRTGEF